MNTQHNYMKPSSQAEAAKDTHPATLGADDGVRSTHTTYGGCECVGNHSVTDMPAGPGAQDWEHWEWTGGDMRLMLTMQQRRWNDTHLGYHKDMDYERGAEMVAAAYTTDDTTAGRWVLVGLWVVRNPTPDSVQQFISRWLDDGIQLASSVMRTRYDYPVFFDRVLLSWDDTVKAIGHAIQGEGWRVDWEWDFNRGADGRVVLTNTKDESAPALVFVDPARCQQAGAGAGMGIRGGSEEAITAAARQAFSGAGTVGGAENTESNGGVPTVGSRAATGDGTNHSDNVSQCGETSDIGGESTSIPEGGYTGDKENSCCTDLRRKGNDATSNAAHHSSCGVGAISTGAPGTGVLGGDTHIPSRRGDAGNTGLSHGDDVAAPGGEKAGMFTNRHPQKENPFADEGGIGAELGFTGARPHECHAGDLFNADDGATVSGERHNSGTCATGVAGAVREHTPAQEPTPAAPGTHGGGNRGCGASKEDSATIGVAGAAGSGGHECGGGVSGDDPIGVSYGVPDGGFSPIVYVDYNHQEQDWFEVYGPDYTDDEGELLPDVAADARHSIPAGGEVVPVSPGSFLQVIDVVKWWLGMDDNVGTSALGALRRAMKRNSALGD